MRAWESEKKVQDGKFNSSLHVVLTMSTYIALAWYDYCEHDSYLMLFFSSIRFSLDPFLTHLFVMLSCESFFISNICMPFIYNASDVVVSLAPLQQQHTLLQFMVYIDFVIRTDFTRSFLVHFKQQIRWRKQSRAHHLLQRPFEEWVFFYFLNTKQKTC